MIEATIPIRLVSLANLRGKGWQKKHKLVKAARSATRLMLVGQVQPYAGPVRVTMTRVGPQLMDTDNNEGALKPVRDEIASLLERDDRPGSGVTFRAQQRVGKTYSVEVTIEFFKEAT